MKIFKYSGQDDSGKPINGSVEAEDKEGALYILSRRDIIVKSIAEEGEEGKKQAEEGISAEHILKISTTLTPHVSAGKLSSFAYELSTLISSGLSLPQALELMVEGESDKDFILTLQEVLREVRAGKTFSDVLKEKEEIFPPIFSALAKSGESTGSLEKSLEHLCSYFENIDKLQNRIFSAMAYPVVVVIVAMIILTGIFIFAVPKFQDIYTHLGVKLPLLTQIFLDVGKYAGIVTEIIIILLLIGSPLAYIYFQSPAGKTNADQWKLKLPILGSIFQQVAISNFLKTMAILVSNGVPLKDSLALAASACGNRFLVKRLIAMQQPLNEGKSLSKAIEETNIVSHQLMGMVSAGERSGKLAHVLDRASDFIDTKAQNDIERLMALMEPALVSGIGFAVGIAIIVLAGPLLSLPSLINTN